MDPEDGIIYDFANNKKLGFGPYRLFTYLSVYCVDKLYLYRLLSKTWYIEHDILAEFLEYMEYKENEKDECDYNNISSIDDDNDSDDENDENEN